MVHGVVSHGVSFLDHPADQVPVPLYIVAHQKERGFCIVLLQGVQNSPGAAVFVPRVKGQVQYFLRGVSQIGGVVPPQLILPRVSHRRRTLLPEAQAPGAGFQAAAQKDPQGRTGSQSQSQQKNGNIGLSLKVGKHFFI